MATGTKHPARDFLFEYFSFRPSQLLRWSPGPDCLLENARSEELAWKGVFETVPEGLVLPAAAFPPHRLTFVRWAFNYLNKIAARPAFSGCFGLHEWAMVYREENIRHGRTPLRLSPDDIAGIVETGDLCCTHYDAYRFFTPLAVPKNRHQLTRDTTEHFDQPGCVHVTMDLYRYAYKIAPWVSGELLGDAFLLAWEARELDMRASPYDMTGYELEPIRIEEATGRQEYVRRQQELTRKAEPIRTKLIKVYERLLEVNEEKRED
ncbi:hypothetical protein [Zavarzinella formosa]|uniref:hypothetical protein n=1 Tax=Zavarzinella formosa TaxID=360055 RepID=UPI0002DC40C4|nr:hypothetical protein [Zavarzinella formosa]